MQQPDAGEATDQRIDQADQHPGGAGDLEHADTPVGGDGEACVRSRGRIGGSGEDLGRAGRDEDGGDEHGEDDGDVHDFTTIFQAMA